MWQDYTDPVSYTHLDVYKRQEQAVREMKEKHKMAFSGYCIALLEDSIPVRYGCVFAVAEEKKTAPEEAARWIDEAFCRRNVDYSDVRELGFLGAPEVLLVTDVYKRQCLHRSRRKAAENGSDCFGRSVFSAF